MRILHTSDWHLGRTLHGESLLGAHVAYADHLVDLATAERVDAVVVSGDVYDRAVPPVECVRLLGDTLERLADVTRVVVTPGNHDSATRLGFAAPLLTDRLVVRAQVAGIGSPTLIPGPDGGDGLLVYGLPYLDPDMARQHLAGPDVDDKGNPRVPARSHEAVMAAAMRRVEADLAQRRAASRVPAVVMAHAFVVGGEASDSERDIRVGGVDSIPHGVFGHGADAVDYVALGHLHGPQRVGPERELGRADQGPALRYSGSPLAYSFSEARHAKSSAIVELGADGVESVELVAAPVPRRLSDVRGTLAELESPDFDGHSDDWVRVTVTGETRPEQLVARVRQRFPHVLVTMFERTGDVRAVSGPTSTERDPVEIMRGFVEQVSGAAATEAEATVLREAYEAVQAKGRSA